MTSRLKTIVIFSHHTRQREAHVNKALIQRQASQYGIDVIVTIDYSNHYKKSKRNGKYIGQMQNLLHALSFAKEGSIMTLHDDCILPTNGLKKLLYILDKAPEDAILSFYNPSNNTHSNALEKGSHVIKMKDVWGQALVYPSEIAKQFIEWCEENVTIGYTGDDVVLSSFAYYENVEMYTILPSLTQHLGRNRSILGIPGSVGGRKRKSENYDPDFDPTKIDWKYHFENPTVNNKVHKGFNGYKKIIE